MLVLIDNFDSFTFNIVHAFKKLKIDVAVLRNHCSLEEILSLNPLYLVIGPGPGSPCQAGISKQCIQLLGDRIPILGICLGHQAIGEVFGGKVKKANYAMHGKTSQIFHINRGIFHSLPQGFRVARYHSLIVEKESLPDCLEVTATTQTGEIMGLKHRNLPIEGVQFHPESIASENGEQLLANFLYQRKFLDNALF